MSTSTKHYPVSRSGYRTGFSLSASRILFSILTATLLLSYNSAQAQCAVTLTQTSIQNPTCGASDGYFVVQVDGIVTPYQFWLYKIIAGAPLLQTNGTQLAGSPTFVGLTAGTYRLDVSKDGCNGTITVVLTQPELVITKNSSLDATCGGTDGYVTFNVDGIVAPYQFWFYKTVGGVPVLQTNGTQLAGNPTFIGLGVGSYRLDVAKGGTCSGSLSVDINQSELTMTEGTSQQPSCGGSDGYFAVNVTGIKAPYQYWLYKTVSGAPVLQENGTLLAGNPTFVGLTAGEYRLDVSKGGTCSGNITVTLEQTPLTMTKGSFQEPSCGGSDGYFSVNVGGIKAPYQYWLYKTVAGAPVLQENGTLIAGNPTFVGLTAGEYRLDVSKGGTCSGNITVVLTQPELTMSKKSSQDASCGATDGYFSVQVDGIKAPYQYYLYKTVGGTPVLQENGTLIAGSPTFVGLGAGDYRLDVSKGGTCSGSINVTVVETPLTMSIGSLTTNTCGGSNGSFSLDVSGISYPYQYTLFKQVNGAFVQQTTGTLTTGSPTFTGLPSGVYKVTLSKGSGCSGSITVYMNCEVIGNEGCSPGYWKNVTGNWVVTNYSPSQTVESVFNVPDAFGLDNMTLLQALQGAGGSTLAGGAQILLRSATAALLNAAHPDVDYAIKIQQIISDVNTALNSGNRNNMIKLATTLDKYNSRTCPIDASRTEMVEQTERFEPPVGAAFLSLKAMPNPTASVFNVQIESSSNEPVSIRVIDMQGRLIESRSNLKGGQSIRIGGNYIPGVYLLEVQQGTNRSQLKLLKGSN